ncbi:MAG: AAA family ATPase [Thermoplasmata archaeon]
MLRAVVAVGGPPGSGKSTAGRALAATFGLAYHSAGGLFRAEAARSGLDLEAFSRYAESHPEIDRTVDEAMARLGRPGALLDGRIQGPLLRRRGVPVYVIAITAAEDERIRRVAARDGQSLAEAARRIRQRAESERTRYRAEYGIDLDREPADLVVDTTELPPAAVHDRIAAYLRAREAGAPP